MIQIPLFLHEKNDSVGNVNAIMISSIKINLVYVTVVAVNCALRLFQTFEVHNAYMQLGLLTEAPKSNALPFSLLLLEAHEATAQLSVTGVF